MAQYILRCVNCGTNFKERIPFKFICPKKCNSLVRSVYHSTIKFKDFPGIWRYYDFLPIKKITDYKGISITYKSSGLAKELGLKNLYISFNGFWNEKKAKVMSCTFKEFEAVLTIQYAKEHRIKKIILASAGNVANAFGYIASIEKFNVFILVPEKNIQDLIVPYVNEQYVKVISVEGDYSDAISLVSKFYLSKDIQFDGGGKSIIRRDALGTVLLNSVEKIRKIPKHYFQSISGGNGVIGVFETIIKLLNDSRFRNSIPIFHISQNEPFIPIVRAWNERRREIKKNDFGENHFNKIYAKVLSNKQPLYSTRGGIFDILQETNGQAYKITNKEAISASKLFEKLEGIDIHPASAVATASLIKAVELKKVNSDEDILLNISGGGIKRVKEIGVQKMKPCYKVKSDISIEELRRILNEI